MTSPVTFFCGYGERGRAHGLPGVTGGPAGVLACVLTESIHYDESGSVCHLVKVMHHVLGGLHRLVVVEPADLRLWRAGHTGVKTGHLPVGHRAASDWLDENWLLANGRFL